MGLLDVLVDAYKSGMGLIAPNKEDVDMRSMPRIPRSWLSSVAARSRTPGSSALRSPEAIPERSAVVDALTRLH